MHSLPGEGDAPEAGTNRCRNCGAFVTARFARVFGDNRDVVHECPECASSTQLLK